MLFFDGRYVPCRRFADVLADARAQLGANVGRYSFIAVDFHHIFLAGLPAHSLALRPAHSRRHLYVTGYTEGFSHFVTSMTAPVASGWSVAGWGSPTGNRRLSRRTRIADLADRGLGRLNCGERTYRGRLGKDQGMRHSRRSIASAKLASPQEAGLLRDAGRWSDQDRQAHALHHIPVCPLDSIRPSPRSRPLQSPGCPCLARSARSHSCSLTITLMSPFDLGMNLAPVQFEHAHGDGARRQVRRKKATPICSGRTA